MVLDGDWNESGRCVTFGEVRNERRAGWWKNERELGGEGVKGRLFRWKGNNDIRLAREEFYNGLGSDILAQVCSLRSVAA